MKRVLCGPVFVSIFRDGTGHGSVLRVIPSLE
jgi:hypothetical protein